MLHIPRFVLVAVVCVFALGCGSKEQDKQQPEETPAAEETAPPEAEQPTAEAEAAEGEAAEGEAEEPSGLVPELEKLAEKACACKDKACASAVQDEVAKLMAEAKEPPEGETQTIANTMQKLQGCVAAVQSK